MRKNTIRRGLRLDAHTVRTITGTRLAQVAGGAENRSNDPVLSCHGSCSCNPSVDGCGSGSGNDHF